VRGRAHTARSTASGWTEYHTGDTCSLDARIGIGDDAGNRPTAPRGLVDKEEGDGSPRGTSSDGGERDTMVGLGGLEGLVLASGVVSVGPVAAPGTVEGSFDNRAI
jgi:hypothetical protein